MLTYDERLNLIIDAQENLRNAIDFIQQAVEGTPLEARADAYVIGHLKSWIDSMYDQPGNLEEIANELEALGLDEKGPTDTSDKPTHPEGRPSIEDIVPVPSSYLLMQGKRVWSDRFGYGQVIRAEKAFVVVAFDLGHVGIHKTFSTASARRGLTWIK